MSSNEEIVLQIKQGENLKNELFENIYKLLYFFCRRYINFAEKQGYETDDLISVSWFGVENAIKSYDINKNLKFTSYLQYHIKNAVYEFLGWKGKEKIIETLSIYEEIKGTEDLTIADTLIDNGAVKEFESIENYGYYDVLTNEIEKLSQEQLDVIKRNFFNNETMSYIAQINGKSYNEISLIKRNGLNKLRKSKEIRKHYYEEFGYKHTSLISFNISQTSSTEWAVMMIEKLRQN